MIANPYMHHSCVNCLSIANYSHNNINQELGITSYSCCGSYVVLVDNYALSLNIHLYSKYIRFGVL